VSPLELLRLFQNMAKPDFYTCLSTSEFTTKPNYSGVTALGPSDPRSLRGHNPRISLATDSWDRLYRTALDAIDRRYAYNFGVRFFLHIFSRISAVSSPSVAPTRLILASGVILWRRATAPMYSLTYDSAWLAVQQEEMQLAAGSDGRAATPGQTSLFTPTLVPI